MSNVIHLPQPPEIIAALRAAGCGIRRHPDKLCATEPELDSVEKLPLVRVKIGPTRERFPSLKTLRSVVAVVCKVSIVELTSERRFIPVCRARQIFFYVARELTGASLPAIGRACGNRDHSTVMHGIAKVTNKREMFEPDLSRVMDYLKRKGR